MSYIESSIKEHVAIQTGNCQALSRREITGFLVRSHPRLVASCVEVPTSFLHSIAWT